MEPIYIIGAGAIGKVLSVCLSNYGKKVVLLRGSVDNVESHVENIRVTLPSQEIIEAEVTIDTLSNYRSLEGLVVLCNKSYGNEALAIALKDKLAIPPLYSYKMAWMWSKRLWIFRLFTVVCFSPPASRSQIRN